MSTPPTKPLLVILSGPTAVGKTQLSLALAKLLDASILSADSRQVYKEMTIGTAKPGEEERALVPHHFIDHLSIHDTYSAGQYESEVISFLGQYFQNRPIALLVGGTTFYIKAVTEGLDQFPKISKEVKEELIAQWESQPQLLLEELEKKDPETFREIDLNNQRRVLRALEVIRSSGKKLSFFKQQKPVQRPFDILYLLLERNRNELYQRINERVLNMIDSGLEQEASELYAFRQKPPLQTVGYQEWWPYFEKSGRTKKEVIEKIQQHTRNYAKRQLTWFRKENFWNRFPASKPEELIHFVQEHPKVKAIRSHFQGDDL